MAIVAVQAQISSATLQASGLTCAMCTKAINKSLEQLNFVESVKPDIHRAVMSGKPMSGPARPVRCHHMKTGATVCPATMGAVEPEP